MTVPSFPIAKRRKGFVANERGAAALEIALWAGVLIVPVLNVVDLGFYTFQKMQVEEAAQVGAQAAWDACSSLLVQPKGTACGATMTNAISTAIQSTSLGGNVTLVTGSPTEGAYCPDATEVLQPVGTYGQSCAAAGYPAGTAGDYIQVAVSYSYSPVFSGVSIVSLLPTPIVRTAWMRLG